jgi:hypothetical protein
MSNCFEPSVPNVAALAGIDVHCELALFLLQTNSFSLLQSFINLGVSDAT